jgi:N-acetylmuramoyl-L-alanine amidase
MHGVSCVRPLILASLLSVWIAGCQTTGSIYTAVPPKEPPPTELEVTTVTIADPVVVVAPEPLPLLPPETNTPPSFVGGRIWPKEWVNAWVPLESWGRFNGLGQPVRMGSGQDPVFQLQTSNGLMNLKMGSKVANLYGQQYGLGFAPRLINGLPYIHSLDARKTLQALMTALLPLPSTNKIVVLDAGHGGRDSGTRGNFTPENEKYYTLDWARRLATLLEARGWLVVMTRTDDTDLSLAERVAIADRAGADLFLSLHFNSGGANRGLAGLETYCLTPTGLPSTLLREFEDDPRETHPNNLYDEQNLQLAARLHQSLLQTTGATDRGVRRARFMAVLRGQQRPAVLIEGGYLSNPLEAARIGSPDYRQALAEGVARALD